jgi:spermidine synthase
MGWQRPPPAQQVIDARPPGKPFPFRLKPFHILARAQTPDNAQLTLQAHDGDFYLKLDGRQLMSTTATVSELMLGELACERLRLQANPKVLIGGLGFGFTLKAVLETVGSDAAVHVAELIPEVIAWNRELLGEVNGKLLDDPRVEVFAQDVFPLIARAPAASYDAIMLDLDDGPVGFIQGKKSYRYDWRGCQRIARALTPGGRAAFWSASEDRPFAQRLERAGFKVQVREVKAHERAKRFAHRIYIAERHSQDAR